jgi:hypothetical protein
MAPHRLASVLAIVLPACAGESRSEDLFGSDEGIGDAGGTPGSTAATVEGSDDDGSSGASASASADDAPADSSGGGGPKLDVGPGGSEGIGDEGGACMGEACSCTAVDLLFVIDNSTSMNDYQVALGAAFPSFADAIIAALPPGTSLHVGVTSTELGYSNAGSTTNCVATGNGLPQEEFYTTPDVSDSGKNGAQGRLFVADGMPYFEIDTDAPPAEVQALRDWFAAASHIGEGGSNVEMASGAAGWAMDPSNAATNAGFIRDEGAVLVIFFLQDEPDQTDAPGMTMAETGLAMLDKIAAAKPGCGGLDCVVAGGFVQQGCLAENALGAVFDGLPNPPALEELPWDDENVDPGYFEPLLTDTLAQVIAQTCDDIGPEG